MSPRVTRSATKLAANPSSAAATQSNASASTSTPAQPQAQPRSRKRKAPIDRDLSPDNPTGTTQAPPARRAKKQKVAVEEGTTPGAPKPGRGGVKQPAAMGKPG